MRFDELPAFQKERRRLGKKHKSLPHDLREFRNVVSVIPLGNSKHFHTITQTGDLHIIKARLFCRYLKGSSLRVIYAYQQENRRIEFIELYDKKRTKNEDRNRIRNYLASIG